MVFGAITDSVLWRGIGLGSAVTVVGAAAKALAPWLAWSWGQPSVDTLEVQDTLVNMTSTWAGVAAMILSPFLIMVAIPDLVLFVATMDMVNRRKFSLRQEPLRAFLMVLGIGVLLSLPLAGVLIYAAGTATLNRRLRTDIAVTSDEDFVALGGSRALAEPPAWGVLRPNGRLARSGKRDAARAELDKSWRRLPLAVRQQVAEVTSIHVVAMMALYVTTRAFVLVSGNLG